MAGGPVVGARYLADTSALARAGRPEVAARLRPLLAGGAVATCGIVDLEVGYSARDAATHAAVLAERGALPRAEVDEAVVRRALEVQGLLARRGSHRLPIADLLVAACAEHAGLTVLHYDADYARIAAVTGQPEEWVVPRGSVP